MAFQKRTIDVGGKPVEVNMEEEFWEQLREIAANRNVALCELLEEAQKGVATKDGRRIASILRVFVLEQYIPGQLLKH